MMALLTLTLLFVIPRRNTGKAIQRLSGILIAISTFLLSAQFAIQYATHWRMTNVTLSVMVNLLLFTPSVAFMSLGMLNLQRQGRLTKRDWLVGVVAWAAIILLLVLSNTAEGVPLLTDTPRLRTAEHIGLGIFFAMQCYYSFLHIHEDILVRKALANYYDRDMGDVVRWIERSILILALMGLFSALFFFSRGPLLIAFSMLIFFGVYYLVISYVCNIVSDNSLKIALAVEAERDTEERASTDDGQPLQADKLMEGPSLSDAERRHVEQAIERWTADGGHLQPDLDIETIANELHVTRQNLSAWVKGSEWQSLKGWLTNLRIEEAKQLLREHPEWSNETIALHCGFSDRSYFQKVFRKCTGTTPAQFIKEGD